MSISRRDILAGTAAMLYGPKIFAASASRNAPLLSEDALSGILSAGGWSEQADDNGGGERVPLSMASQWVKATSGGKLQGQALIDLGALPLTLAVAEWGVDWQGAAAPADPAKQSWKGPQSIRAGKHLMSYALGGLGLPHLDVTDAVAFFDHLATLEPKATDTAKMLGRYPGGFKYDKLRAAGGLCGSSPSAAVAMVDLDGEPFRHDAAYYAGEKYCHRFETHGVSDPKDWQAFRHWARKGLRRRDMQRWITDRWIEKYWLPSCNLVLSQPHGSIEEAFVVSRIWNSRPALANKLVKNLTGVTDQKKRIDYELDEYGKLSETYRGRKGLMQRPGVIYQQFRTG